ncbi:hypothetical protein XCR_0246 [Xanthomonas campestris pv. raphani 756C]|nr:hypothetical protein XCR_0246 [Xanthomonas campestris pv. raphani 756C]
MGQRSGRTGHGHRGSQKRASLAAPCAAGKSGHSWHWLIVGARDGACSRQCRNFAAVRSAGGTGMCSWEA